jgi:hypothetical protein
MLKNQNWSFFHKVQELPNIGLNLWTIIGNNTRNMQTTMKEILLMFGAFQNTYLRGSLDEDQRGEGPTKWSNPFVWKP